jgi:23S rRNA G2445 N2-methylase RlmL
MIKFKVADVRNLWVFKQKEFEIQSVNYKIWQTSIEENKQEELTGTLVSNPPYGLRLEQDDVREIHEEINQIFKNNRSLKWWIITSFLEFDNIIMKKFWKTRKLYNWRELCYFYSKATDNTRWYRR